MIDIVRTVTGERHTDLAVDPIDRTIAHVDRLVGCSKGSELLENRKYIRVIDNRLQAVYGAIAKLVKEVRLRDFFFHINAVSVRVISKIKFSISFIEIF